MLDQHYNDRFEVAAVLVVALCVLGPLMLGSSSEQIGAVPAQISLGLCVCSGLLTGRPRRRSD